MLWWLACVPEVEPWVPPEVGMSEVHPENTSGGPGLVDYEGDSADWFELFNGEDEPLDLAGFGLTNHPENPPVWAFPEGVVIPALEFLIVFADGSPSAGSEIHTPVRLESPGSLRLFGPEWFGTREELDGVSWEAVRADTSLALQADGTWAEAEPSPLAPSY